MPGGVISLARVWGDFWGPQRGPCLGGKAGVIRGVHDLVEMWGLLRALSGVCDLEGGTGEEASASFMAWMGLHKSPSGVYGLQEDMGNCREIPVVCSLEGASRRPQQPQCPLLISRAMQHRGGMCHELVHTHAHQERQCGHACGC